MAKMIITAPKGNMHEYAQHAVDQLHNGCVSGHYDMDTFWYLEDDEE